MGGSTTFVTSARNFRMSNKRSSLQSRKSRMTTTKRIAPSRSTNTRHAKRPESARRLRMRSTSKRSARIVLSKCSPRPATRPTSMRSAVLSLSSASSTLPTRRESTAASAFAIHRYRSKKGRRCRNQGLQGRQERRRGLLRGHWRQEGKEEQEDRRCDWRCSSSVDWKVQLPSSCYGGLCFDGY